MGFSGVRWVRCDRMVGANCEELVPRNNPNCFNDAGELRTKSPRSRAPCLASMRAWSAVIGIMRREDAAEGHVFFVSAHGHLPPARGAFMPRRRRAFAGDDDARVLRVLLHQLEQDLGIVRMQADAAVRRRAAEMRDLVAAVDGVAFVEEDRPR